MTAIPKPPTSVPAARMPSDVSPLAPQPPGDGLAAMRAQFLDDYARASAERPRRPPR